MSDNNGWPGKPGVPPNEGWWWILFPLDVQGIRYFDGELWRIGGQLADPKDFATYALIGPVLTPAEVEARVKEVLLEAADLCDQLSEHTGGICAIAIREMADPAKGEGNE
jgi:hypothetical protein